MTPNLKWLLHRCYQTICFLYPSLTTNYHIIHPSIHIYFSHIKTANLAQCLIDKNTYMWNTVYSVPLLQIVEGVGPGGYSKHYNIYVDKNVYTLVDIFCY